MTEQLPPSPTEAYANLDNPEAIEREARARQEARIKEQQASAGQKQEELAAVVKEAHQQHAVLKDEQVKLAKQRSRDIDQLIREAEARQENAHQAKMRDIQQKRDEIYRLQQESEKKYSSMSPEEREKRGKQLQEMMSKALRKYQELESEQQRNIHEDQQKLKSLAQQIDVEKHRLQKEQGDRLKKFLSEIVDSAAAQQQHLKQQSKEIVDQEKSDLNELTGGANAKYQEMLKGFADRMNENAKYVREQLEQSKKLIVEGKINDALRLRAELQRKTYDLQSGIRREQNQLASRIKMTLLDFEQEVSTDSKTLQSRHDELIEHVQMQMDADAKEEIKSLQREFTDYTRDSLIRFEDSVLNQNRQVELEQLLAIKKLKAQMAKQAQETMRRQHEDQAGLFNHTLKLVSEIERQSKTNQSIIEQGQHLMMRTAMSSVSEMQEKGRNFEKDMYREQQELMEQGYRETLALVQEARAKQQKEREEITHQFLDERLSISREATEAHKKVEEEQLAVSAQLQEERIDTGRDLQEEMLKIQHERQELTKYELERASELAQETNERQKKVTEDYQHALQDARRVYKDTIHQLNERQKLLMEDQKRLEDLIHQTRRQHRENENEELQKELQSLIQRARAKQEEIKQQHKETSKHAREAMEKSMEEAQARRKEQKHVIRAEHEAALAEHERDVKIRDEKLRLTQQLLVKQQEGDLGAVMAKIDSYLDSFRDQRKKIISEVQQKLRTLEDDYTTKRQGTDQ